jgi:proline iminopeptidase
MKNVIILLTSLISIVNCKKINPNEEGNLVAKTVSEDSNLPAVQLSETKIHCQAYGSSDSVKIFVLEGGPGDDFRYLLDLNKTTNGWSLPDHYQVIYHDYRGCGLSQRHPMEELTQAKSLNDLSELIDHYAPKQKVILIGHSHGGTVAAQYLNAHPDRVKGIVFIEPGSFSSEINKKQPKANAINFFAEDINQILWIKQLIGLNNHAKADYAYDVGKINRENTARGESCTTSNYRGGAASAIAIAINEVSNTTFNYTSLMSTFVSKVLFISSDKSDLGYDFQQENQASLFLNYEHIKVLGTGHNGLINCRTDETLNYIKLYLEKL